MVEAANTKTGEAGSVGSISFIRKTTRTCCRELTTGFVAAWQPNTWAGYFERTDTIPLAAQAFTDVGREALAVIGTSDIEDIDLD